MQDTDSQLRRALNAVHDMRSRLEARDARDHEPVAIVGMACRFPGGDDARGWWRTLAEGRDAVTLVPPERWDRDAFYDPDPDAPGKMNTRWGGFIDGVDRFDAAMFGISPREAVGIDPQQRLLLEVSWHALEDAGIAPDRLGGTRTGVYVGMSTNDYARVLSENRGDGWIDAHASTGNSVSVAAGRIAYTLGLQGPAMVIDTACSSSLVAVHQAVRALRAGEVAQALAAGVNLTLLPELTVGFSKARMMAADGRCKTFDAAADGYVRGEGCGVVVLKRLSDALAAGDRIHAVVLGSAVNHDGRSNGLTAPNGPAQVAVIRAALADAKVSPAQVSCIEAHGTGTSLGDPIEARALGEVFGGDRGGAAMPLLGSVKTQIGHLEAAAGIAGLIKLALALREKTIPPHLHFEKLNPHIAEDGFAFRIPTAATPWEPIDGQRIAGVSSFGFSGTNAHVVLGEHKTSPSPLGEGRGGGHVLPLSARDPAALETLRTDLTKTLREPGLDLAALAGTLGAGRAHQAHRLAIVAENADAAIAALATAKAERAGEPPKVAFLFTGQGCQYTGMARGLLGEPRFRETLQRCDAALGAGLGAPLSALVAGDAKADLARTDVLQPLLFAIEYAVADLWRSWGVEPAAVLGHSLGEIAAACFAGAMDLEAALPFVAERGRLMQACEGRGGMAAALAPAERVADLIAGSGVVIAAYNAPTTCVIAGEAAALARAITRLDAAGIATQKLEVATAFHSAALDSCLPEFERAASLMAMRPARLPIASNLHGAFVHEFDAAYWRRQAREPVRFAQGFAALVERGCNVFVEVGPHPVLAGFGRVAAPDATFLPSLRRGADDRRTLGEALAAVYRKGADIEWRARVAPGTRRADAPLYPFQRERYWPEGGSPPHPRTEGEVSFARRIPSPISQRLYETYASTASLPFLADHVVFGEVVVPGAMHVVMALAALRAEGVTLPAVEDVVFEQALTVPEDGVRVQLVLETDGAFALSSAASDGEWIRHASGRAIAHSEAPPAPLDITALQAALGRDTAGPGALFEMLAKRGIVLGPAFRGARALWRGNGEALAEITLPESLRAEAGALPIHPAMLDACFQTLGATFGGAGAEGGFLPLSIDHVRMFDGTPGRIFCHARSMSAGTSGQVAVGNFTFCDATGRVVMTVEGLQVKRVEAPPARDPLEGAYLALEWSRAELGEAMWGEAKALVAALSPSQWEGRESGGGRDSLAEGLERLAEAYAADARTVSDVIPAKARLFRRVQQLAARHRGTESGDALAQRLREAHPGNTAEIDLVARCGGGLGKVLRGEADPLQLLFAEGGDGGGIYGAAGLARDANAMAAAAVAEAIARRNGRALRVIEVGGGTGATTELVLPALAAAPGSRYLFTDISPAFLKAASARFGEAIETAVFDAEKPPEAAARSSFDIVIAANVVHATANVHQSLTNLRALLAPGGVLVMVESTRAQQWWDLVFGLTDGWWRFTDTDLRPDHPLLTAQAWRTALAAAGFASSAGAGADREERLSVLVARAPALPVLAVHDGREGASRALAEALERELAARDVECTVLAAEAAIERLSLAPAKDEPATTVVYTGALGDGPDRLSLRQAFELTRAMAIAGRERLCLVTRGARGPGPVSDPEVASLWGLGEVAALEHPELQCRRVDLDAADPHPAATLAAELMADDGENAVGYRGGERRVSRLVPATLPSDTPMAFARDATCLVAGAFGGLGPLLAQWLVEHGAGTLVLVGRREPPPEVAAQLKALGAQVHLRSADVTDARAMGAIVDEIRATMPPLHSVFHLAGSVADGAIISQDWTRFTQVLGAKADGAKLLHRLTANLPLRHFVMFSTSASLIGNRGQANHAAANACLDALAHHRRAQGLPALSINWGAWSGAGAVVAGEYAARMAERGVKTIAPEAGFRALGRAMAGELAQVGVIALDWPKFLAGYGERVPAFFAAMASRAARGGASRRTAPKAPAIDLRRLMEDTPPAERMARLEAFLQGAAAEVLGMADASRIEPDYALNELGLDSLLAIELRNRLGAALGARQPATLLFNYPSVAALAQHFASELIPAAPQAPPSTRTEDAMRSEIAALSDAELEALIAEEFGALHKP